MAHYKVIRVYITHLLSLFQIDNLMKFGTDILAPIPIGSKRLQGTAVDYAYYMYNQVSYALKPSNTILDSWLLQT